IGACLQRALPSADAAGFETCVTADSTRVAKARTKLTATVGAKWGTAPNFGFTSAATAAASATAQEIALLRDVFGGDLSLAIAYGGSDPGTASCQRAVQK